jgi:hopene-associated glycosyltransferase HpnB
VTALVGPAGLALAAWSYLAIGRGRFWSTALRLPSTTGSTASDGTWPEVTAVVPARDEAAVLPMTLPSLLAQDYPGRFRVVVVDDASSDGTGDVARRAGANVVTGTGPPSGWAGKVAAMAVGVGSAGTPEYLLFTDADVHFPPGALTALVAAAGAYRLDLLSQMVRLRAVTRWERLIVPAFVYFFAQLYPFSRVNDPRSTTAAAAGGCMLVRREALEAAGGLARIAAELIDDVALGRLIKSSRAGSRIWLGLSPDIRSVRPYARLSDLWAMVSRSAYTQLRYSPWLLAGTAAGLLLGYVVPPAAAVVGVIGGDALLATLDGAAWAIMAATYVPMLRFYGLSPARSVLLPVVAVGYLAMTVDSARQHRRGRGGAWKGRTVARPADDHLADPR